MVNNNLTININGKDVGLTFGLLQVKEFEAACVGNLDLFFDDSSFITEAGLTRLIYTASQNYRMLHSSVAVSIEEIYEWLIEGRKNDEIAKQIVEVAKVWAESEHTQTWLDEKKKEAEVIRAALKKPSKKSKENLSKSKRFSGAKATGRKK